MANSPELVMVAGPNGSGKSTLIAALRASPDICLPKLYINADDILRDEGLSDPGQAQQQAQFRRAKALQGREDLMYETVMSHPSKIAELQLAKQAGYLITIHLVATNDPDINVERVGARVHAGGHDVPEDRIRARYERTLALAPAALGYASQALIFDNTARGATAKGLQLQAHLDDGSIALTVPTAAEWVRTIVGQVQERATELDRFARAQRLNTGIADLNGSTRGQIIAIGKHYALQYDEATSSGVLHDKSILGNAAFSNLQPNQHYSITYAQGVATPERLPGREPPAHTR